MTITPVLKLSKASADAAEVMESDSIRDAAHQVISLILFPFFSC